MAFQKVKGSRDFFPEFLYQRDLIFSRFETICKAYNFNKVESPAFEYLDILNAKGGEEINSQIFTLERRSEKQLGLRFDMTVPLARMFIEISRETPKPVKWYYLSRMWRYEQPQSGRLREFYQMGVELFGAKNEITDALILSLAIDFLESIGLDENDVRIKISNRDIIEGFLEQLSVKKIKEVISVIDKRSKLSEKSFYEMLLIEGLEDGQIRKIEELLKCNKIDEVEEKVMMFGKVKEGIENLRKVYDLLSLKSKYLDLELGVVRGLDYYTGIVFECFDVERKYRSIFGGGRYDKLIENFGGEFTPATGFAIGDAVLELVMREKGVWPKSTQKPYYFIATVNDNLKEEAMILLRDLVRSRSCDIDLMGRNLKKQLDYANKIGAEKVIIVGEDEIKENCVIVKDMGSGEENKVSIEDL